MSMYEVGTVTGAINQAKVTGATTKWSQAALGVQAGSILVVYRNGSADLYAIKSVDSDTQITLTRNITTAFSAASYGIITSETASTSSFANQLASAFSLWRSVVAGWSAALTGNGNITMTDPMTGASVTVPALKGMATIAGGNNLTGTQSIDSDDSGVILGKNGDIGLIKKNGTFGKLMVGHSTRFSVVRSANDRISATDVQTEIMGIDGNDDVFFNRNINAGRSLYTQSIELSYTTPYIDFHYGNSTADYSGRLIQDAADQISFTGSHLRTERDLRVGGMAQFNNQVKCIGMDAFLGQLPSDPAGKVGDIIQGPHWSSRFNVRGKDNNTAQGRSQLWFEENVGYNHRMVVEVAGFNAAVQYWHFRSDGQIWGSTKGDVAWAGTSDIRFKRDVESYDGQESLDNINALKLVKFIYKDDDKARVRRGVIAQQAMKVDECYVKRSFGSILHSEKRSDDGALISPEWIEEKERLIIDSNPLLMDAVSAIQVLSRQVSELRAENSELRSLLQSK